MMKITFELWQLITLALSVGAAFAGVGKALLWQYAQTFKNSLAEIKRDSDQWHELELKFYQHLADLPVSYVRREDYIRGQTVIEAKLDSIFSSLKAVQIQRGNS
jgi:hypothetical protein